MKPRDPTDAELRAAVLPHCRALGCSCEPEVRWRRQGKLASIEVEHQPWCRVGRDGVEPVVIVKAARR